MADRKRSRAVILLLGIAAIAALWRAAAVERDKQRVAAAYQEAQAALEQLSAERTELSKELDGARDTIAGQTTSLSGIQEELDRVQGELEGAQQELAALQQERQALRSENASLATQLTTIQTEKAQLEARLSNIRELKLAIHDVRRQIWQRRLAALNERWQARVEERRRQDREELASGNRGYLLHDGLSTLGQGPRLHVHVLEPRAE